ncbi:MAG: sulfatase [Myxococcota bacterium]
MASRLFGRRSFYVTAAILLVLAAIALQVEVRTNPRPLGKFEDIATLAERNDVNVLFILIDTLRADRLSAYGYERDTSPHIKKLASTGVRFAEQLSQSSWTKCSMASLWTGLYPARTGVTRSPQAISEDAQMPAEILRDAGFRTFAIWRNGWIRPAFGFSQGFEVYHSPRAGRVPPAVHREKPTGGVSGTDQDTVNSAIEFLRSHEDERWFLYLHLMDVHQYVYDEDTALFGTTYSDIYDNSIRWVDRVLGSLIQDLDARGLRDKTLIVLAADHGEAFGEHGREGHARDVYGEVTTTPFILSFPFRLKESVVVESATENVDLWPTLLDLLGLPGLEAPDGRSRLPELMAAVRGEPAPPSDTSNFAYIDQSWGRSKQAPRPMVAVGDGRYRLLHRAVSGRGELYDRSVDALEAVDISEEEPEVYARLTEKARELLDRTPAWEVSPDVELGESELDQLRALGYDVQ